VTPEREALAAAIAKVAQWQTYLAEVDRRLNDGWLKILSLGEDIAAVEADLAKLPERRALDELMGVEDPAAPLTARLDALRSQYSAQHDLDAAARAERRNLADKAEWARQDRDVALGNVVHAEGIYARLIQDYDVAYERLQSLMVAIEALPAAAVADENWWAQKQYNPDGSLWSPDESVAAPIQAWLEALKSDAAAPLPGAPGQKLRKAA
jgi:hypothetical protein